MTSLRHPSGQEGLCEQENIRLLLHVACSFTDTDMPQFTETRRVVLAPQETQLRHQELLVKTHELALFRGGNFIGFYVANPPCSVQVPPKTDTETGIRVEVVICQSSQEATA